MKQPGRIILKDYFLLNDPLENAWTIFLLTGKNNKRFLSGKLLKTFFSEIYELPLWLIDSCYLKVGDSAEVITLLLKNKKNIADYKLKNTSLNELLIKILPEISVLNNEDRKLKIRDLWQSLPEDNHLVFNKILTGTFRIGVSIGIIKKAL